MQDLLTVADVARLVDRTPDAVRKAADEGRIKVVGRTVGGVRLFDRAEAERFLRELRPRAADRGVA